MLLINVSIWTPNTRFNFIWIVCTVWNTVRDSTHPMAMCGVCTVSHTHSCSFAVRVFLFFFLYFTKIESSALSLCLSVCMKRWRIIRFFSSSLSVLSVYERVEYLSVVRPLIHLLDLFNANENRLFKVERTNPSADCSALWFIHYYKCVTHRQP